jgi:hypothetical protein
MRSCKNRQQNRLIFSSTFLWWRREENKRKAHYNEKVFSVYTGKCQDV